MGGRRGEGRGGGEKGEGERREGRGTKEERRMNVLSTQYPVIRLDFACNNSIIPRFRVPGNETIGRAVSPYPASVW